MVKYSSQDGDGYVHKFNKFVNFQKKIAIPKSDPTGVYGKGNWVYSYYANKIYEYPIDGVFMGVITEQNQPIGLGVDSDGKFYVSEHTTI